jgi:PPOX class probable F420-dependent enzyme
VSLWGSLSDATVRLLDGRNYAVLATVNADGSPQTSAMWVGRDGGDLLLSTVLGRLKYRNMLRDPRVSVTVHEAANPYNYAELRGRAEITPDPGGQMDNGCRGSTTGRTRTTTPGDGGGHHPGRGGQGNRLRRLTGRA